VFLYFFSFQKREKSIIILYIEEIKA